MGKIFLIIFCFAVLFLFSFFFLLELRRVSLQRVTAWNEDYKADCAVVLTGGAGRIREGFDLLSRGSVRKLIISGVHFNAVLDDIFPQRPFYGDIKAEDIILEKQSRTTYGNAQQTYILVQQLQCEDLLLITSYLHMYRAYKVFRKNFPPQYRLYKVAVAPPSHQVSAESYVMETFKSLFYSLWAY
ncbi:MAG: YdcF family protein [Bdellovibrionales bacterium]|nr:YdcF family protein [Bdellovibrionales bacterium]